MQSAAEVVVEEEEEKTTLLLTKQQEQIKKKKQIKKKEQQIKKPGFFILRKKGAYNSWNPVALYDNENHYRGVAYFTGLWECLQYKKKLEDKAINNFLKESKGSGVYGKNNTIGKHSGMMNENIYKIFIERSIPSIKPQFLR